MTVWADWPRRPKEPTPPPPEVSEDPAGLRLRALNVAYGWGVMCGVTGDDHHTRAMRDGLSGPTLDQFHAGWRDGKKIWSTVEPA